MSLNCDFCSNPMSVQITCYECDHTQSSEPEEVAQFIGWEQPNPKRDAVIEAAREFLLTTPLDCECGECLPESVQAFQALRDAMVDFNRKSGATGCPDCNGLGQRVVGIDDNGLEFVSYCSTCDPEQVRS